MKKQVKIFGCGLSGATMSRLLAQDGYQVEIFDVKENVAGNCYDCFNKQQILIHQYGPHIFHTNNEQVYEFITKFCDLNDYKNEPLVSIEKKLYPFPFNYESIDLKYNSEEAKYLKSKLSESFPNKVKASIFDVLQIDDDRVQAFAKFVYENIYVNYSVKMWGVEIKDIDLNVINRVGITLGYNRSYFPEDKYQGLPVEGYTKLVEKILDHPNIKISLKFDTQRLTIIDSKIFIDKKPCNDLIYYCGSIDELFNYCYGILPYRSLNFKFENFATDSYQTAAIINYPNDLFMTRISEYKKMTFQNSSNTAISKEFPGAFDLNNKLFDQRYYPIKNLTTQALYEKYLKLVNDIPNLHLLGRLGEYQYYDMDDAIAAAFVKYQQLKNK